MVNLFPEGLLLVDQGLENRLKKQVELCILKSHC